MASIDIRVVFSLVHNSSVTGAGNRRHIRAVIHLRMPTHLNRPLGARIYSGRSHAVPARDCETLQAAVLKLEAQDFDPKDTSNANTRVDDLQGSVFKIRERPEDRRSVRKQIARDRT